MFSMYRLICLSVSVFLSQFILSQKASSEILKTRSDVYQTTDERGKVIISRDEQGIFIVYGRPINIQIFDPSQMVSQGSKHVFISYDSSLNGYTKLTYGNKKSYRIIGSLSFIIGNLRVAIDNNHGYCSVTELEGESDSLGILGFRGVEPVARYKGSAAAALLEANQLESYQKVVKSFEFNGEALTLNGNQIEASAVGLSFEIPPSPCIPGRDKVFLNPTELARIRKLGAKDRLQHLEGVLKTQRRSNPLEKLILIRVAEKNAIGIDYERGVVTVVRPYSDTKENQICILEDVSI
jgi:hypothetical protein